ncbi:hypothetical protein AB0I98_47435 [Streptomyces sp. NPDC050211]|uniref:hypothetical protein n=1 Tax=Streptomyces sp. NPDC050211 TaxID=3154932 RepID=UPI003447B6CB
MRLKSLEEALADARVLDGQYDTYDVAKARGRIAKEVARSRWESLFELRLPRLLARRRCGDNAVARPLREGDHRRTPRPVKAAQDLYALASIVVQDREAPSYVSRFANSRRIEPDGALIFACVLDLAQQEEGAQFWWQFAAGAGSATSAYCLYLMHLRRGEVRDAEHWARQVERLDAEPDQYRPRVDELKPWRAERPRAALRHAVNDIDTSCDEDYGLVPHLDPALAGRLAELAAAG